MSIGAMFVGGPAFAASVVVATCEPCTRAEANPRSGIYQTGCKECESRMLAHSPAMAESAKAEALLPAYRSALQHLFGEDWKEGHERVKRWAEKLRTTR